MRVFPRPASRNQSEIRIYLSDPDGTLFGYVNSKADCGLV